MRPWIRMYREERGTFAQLPLVCRGIAMELLKLTDDEGIIRIGRKTPVDAIAFALGATRADRQALTKYIPMLLEDGFLVHEGDRIVVPGFPRFQCLDVPAHAPRPNVSPTPTKRSADVLPTSCEPTSDDLPTSREPHADVVTSHNQPKSHVGTVGALSDLREEKNREDGDGEPRASALATAPHERMLRSLTRPTKLEAEVVALVSETRQAAGGAPYRPQGHRDRDTVQRLVEWSETPNIGMQRLREALVAFWAARGTGAALSWLAEEEPGRYLGEVRSNRSRGMAKAGTHEEHAAVVAAHGGKDRGYAIVPI